MTDWPGEHSTEPGAQEPEEPRTGTGSPAPFRGLEADNPELFLGPDSGRQEDAPTQSFPRIDDPGAPLPGPHHGIHPPGLPPAGSPPPGLPATGSHTHAMPPAGPQPYGMPPADPQLPGTQPPGTQPPGTQPPGTQPPGTQPPGTQPPGTQPPDMFSPGMQAPGALPGLPPVRSRSAGGRTGNRKWLLGGIAAAVLVVAGAAVGAYALLHTRGTPQETAQEYLTAWQQNRLSAMQQLSVGVPTGGLARPVQQAEADLGVQAKTLQLGTVTSGSGRTARAAYTAQLTLGNGIHWSYQGALQLVSRNRHWWVSWSDADIYPQLRPDDHFQVSAHWLTRGPIYGAEHTRLDFPQVQQESPSVAMITGTVGPLTAAQAKKLGRPYEAGDMAGQGGIEQAYERRLAGKPNMSIQLVNAHGQVQRTLGTFGGQPGAPVWTTINMTVQQAASRAVASAKVGNKAVAMVALQPSTGSVLAVVNRPGGFDRALLGSYPPGSTFKMVTASALAQNGMAPGSSVQCPAKISIDGQSYHNYNYEKLGQTSLLNAFAVSCNTTFASLGSQQLGGGKLQAMAEEFGFNSKPVLGIPANLGKFTPPTGGSDLAQDSFGQGEDIVDPLQLASVAGAIGNGTWHSPQLVLNPRPSRVLPQHTLGSSVTSAVRPMMAAVVNDSDGTAAHVGFPPGVYGKTGTAEYGSGKNPPAHAWFAGYRGDLAFAVIVEDGGFGADASGPIANAFVRGS